MRLVPAFAALAIVGGLVAVAPPAGAFISSESFAVSPKSPVTAGAMVTVWEDDGGCSGSAFVTIGGGPGPDVSGETDTDVQGGWTIDLVAPVVTGSYTIHVLCIEKKKAIPVIFTDESLDIVAVPMMQIAPPSGPAGTTIDVGGTECSFTGVSISLVSDPNGAATVLDSAAFNSDTTDWTGHLTVPADAIATADGGDYAVEATCGNSVEFTFDYVTLPFVVTTVVVPTTTTTTTTVAPTTPTTGPPAVKATPVKANATFTG